MSRQSCQAIHTKLTLVSVLSIFTIVFTFLLFNFCDACFNSAKPESPKKTMQRAANARIGEMYGRLPLAFEENQGQFDSRVRFISRGNGYTVLMTASETVMILRSGERKPEETSSIRARHSLSRPETALRMKLIGSNPDPQLTVSDELPTKFNYFIGKNRANWRSNVAVYRRLKYRDVYPGIDVTYYGNQQHLEYDFIVSPGTNPQAIALRFEGMENIQIDRNGDLVLHTLSGEIRQPKPRVYQEKWNGRQEIAADYIFDDNGNVGFRIGYYDPTQPLVIDPVVDYSTLLGGAGVDISFGVSVDAEGHAYVVGSTSSTNFPTLNPFQSGTNVTDSSSDVFVAKLSPTGDSLEYSTYIGGAGNDSGNAIAVDASGNAYFGGTTGSLDFPTTPGAYRTTTQGCLCESFAAKLNPTGDTLVYSTYLGTNGGAAAGVIVTAVAIDSFGNMFVTGSAGRNLPTTVGVFQTTSNEPNTAAFVTKLNESGSSPVYTTYLGKGSASGIAVDAQGNAYVGGLTAEQDFNNQIFLVKLNQQASALVYATLIDALPSERVTGIAIDTANQIYITGATSNSGFPTTCGAFKRTISGINDAFVTKFDSSGSIVYSTLIGGSDVEVGFSVAVDPSGSAIITGLTRSADFPLVHPFQSNLNEPPCTGECALDRPGTSAFVTKLNSAGSALTYSTYLSSGHGNDVGRSIAVDSAGGAYVTGSAQPGFPTINAFQPVTGGRVDAFVAKINGPWESTGSTTQLNPSTLPPATVGVTYNQVFSAAAGVALSNAFIACGELPPGMDLSSTGLLFGAPDTDGHFDFTIKATDVNGSVAVQTFTLDVSSTLPDTTPPLIIAPADASYECASLVPPADAAQATASDNSGSPVVITVTQNSNGGTGSIGDPLILRRTFTATDTAGNSADAIQIITVADRTNPTMIAPADVTIYTDPAGTSCSALVSETTLGTANASDNCGSVSISRSGVPPGNVFPVGTTTITYVATDGAANMAQATQRVTVVDKTAPIITCPANILTETDPGTCTAMVNYNVTASDNCGVSSLTTNLPSGSAFPLGTSVVTATATDMAGNVSNCSFTVTVTDRSSLGSAKVWLGLKNSDGVGAKFDLLAEVFKGGTLVGTGQLDAVPAGSSGFNNAVARTINLAVIGAVNCSPGDTLSIRLSVRIAVGVSGHRSGTARLWFNDSAADSHFDATIGGVTRSYYLTSGSLLSLTTGSGPKNTIDVFVDRAVGGNPFKPFGTWSFTF